MSEKPHEYEICTRCNRVVTLYDEGACCCDLRNEEPCRIRVREVQPSPQEIYFIARCPVHGLHGERTECFECGGPVEQVPMREVQP